MADISAKRASFARAWLLLFSLHAVAIGMIWLARSLALPGWLRDPLGIVSVFTLYGPIALAAKLGATRATFERAAWLFGDITPAGWGLVVASWLLVHALIAWAWTAWRSRSA